MAVNMPSNSGGLAGNNGSNLSQRYQTKRKWYKSWWGIILLFFVFLAICFLIIFFYQVFYYYNKVKSGGEFKKTWLTNQEATNVNLPLGFTQETVRQLAESNNDPYFGHIDARVVIVEFSDFECPFCKMAYPEVKKVIEYYGDSIHFIYRDFPLETLHKNAILAAEAAECADDQDSFWLMHDQLFENQEELSYETITTIAKNLGLSARIFKECLDGNKYLREVQEDFKDGGLLGVSGTPTFFINGQKYVGALKFEDFREIIDRELGN